MNDIGNPVSRIEDTFGKARHIGWDFAADGDWPRSGSFLFNAQKQPGDVFSWLGKQTTPDIACEALFELESGVRFFFGISTTHLSDDEKKKVISKFLAMPRDSRSLVETVDGIRNVFGSELPFDTTPQCLVLSVAGLWQKAGELLVWRQGGHSTILPFEQIPNHAPAPDAEHSPLYESQPKNIILEAHMGTEETFRCWLGFPVSVFDEGPPVRHMLSRDAYYSVANTLSPGII